MITDKMLAQAAAELATAINESLPEPTDCTHEFSAEFERKMKRITRRANHPILYRTLRSVASIILVITIGFGSVLVVSAEARAAVFGWVREQYESFYEYFFEGEATSEKARQYSLEWIPEGSEMVTFYEIPGGEVFVFADTQDRIIQFTYTTSKEGSSLFVDTVEYEQYDVTVNSYPAKVYMSLSPDETNAIIWIDTSTDTLFYISAPFEQAELLKMAENVIVKK